DPGIVSTREPHSRVVRGTGATDPARNCDGGPRPGAHVLGAKQEGEPTGPAPARARSGRGSVGRDLPGTWRCNGGGPARDPESRRGLRTLGSELPPRAAGVHAEGCR